MATLSVGSVSSGDTTLSSTAAHTWKDQPLESTSWQHEYSDPLLSPPLEGSSPSRTDAPWPMSWLPFCRVTPSPPPSSRMYTIIPLSDSRLRPQKTTLWLSVAACFVAMLIAAVFFLVPRGVSVASLGFVPHNWHRNTTAGTYALHLGVHVPVHNNNFYPVEIKGQIDVLFLDVVAGSSTFGSMSVAARSPKEGHELHFCMDASGVPVNYGLTIVQICMLYPRKLMFICRADLSATTWLGSNSLPTIDTYFMVDCFAAAGPSKHDPDHDIGGLCAAGFEEERVSSIAISEP